LPVAKKGKGKVAETNTAKVNTDKAVKSKGKDAKTEKVEALDLCDMLIYDSKNCTVGTDKKGEYVIIKAKIVKTQSANSFTLVNLGGFKSAKNAPDNMTGAFADAGGYINFLIGYTKADFVKGS